MPVNLNLSSLHLNRRPRLLAGHSSHVCSYMPSIQQLRPIGAGIPPARAPNAGVWPGRPEPCLPAEAACAHSRLVFVPFFAIFRIIFVTPRKGSFRLRLRRTFRGLFPLFLVFIPYYL